MKTAQKSDYSCMTQHNLLELAKQGDVKAISSLINHQLASQGIVTKVSRHDDCLKVLFESEGIPSQQHLVGYVKNALKKLESPVIQKVIVCGQKAGSHIPAWQEGLDLSPALTTTEQAIAAPPQLTKVEKFLLAVSFPILIGILIYLWWALRPSSQADPVDPVSGFTSKHFPASVYLAASWTENYELSQRLAKSASELSQNPPHSLDQWQKIEKAWQSAIAPLRTIPENAPIDIGVEVQKKRSVYEQNLITVQKYIKRESSKQSSPSIRRRSSDTLVKLVPYSGAISHPRSKVNEQREKANRDKFLQVFQTTNIYLAYQCVYNHRGLLSSASLGAVYPQNLYSLVSSEFDDSVGSYFRSNLCSHGKSATLRSVGVSVSIIEQP